MRETNSENGPRKKRCEMLGPLDKEEVRGVGKELAEAEVIIGAGAEAIRVDVKNVFETGLARRSSRAKARLRSLRRAMADDAGSSHENEGGARGNFFYAQPFIKSLHEGCLAGAEPSVKGYNGRATGRRSFFNDARSEISRQRFGLFRGACPPGHRFS